MNTIFERPTLNRKTADENIAIVDRWIADTVDKLNVLKVPEGSKHSDEDVPTKLSDLQDDSGHRTVTDTEKATWNNKASKSQVNTLENNIGDLTDLETQDKDNLVDAINELAQSDNSSWGHITGDIDDQTDLQDALDDKANLNSPAFTGTPTAPTAASGTNTTQIATTAFVQGEVGSKYDVNDGVENDLQDDDKIPFYDDSASAKRNILWSNIVAKIKSALSTVATTGNYADLSNKPFIPNTQKCYTSDAEEETDIQDWNYFPFSSNDINDYKYNTTWANIKAKLKAYFDTIYSTFSGSYNDLSNKPTIPSVGNGTLTIQRNGTNIATFTANQSGNATANISVPTNTWRGYQFLTKSASFSVNANSTTTVTFNGLNNVSGYTPIIAWPAYVDSSGKWQRIIALNFSNKVSNGSVSFNLLNMNTSSASGTLYVNVLYLQ